MKCTNCGAEIPAGAMFCVSCGSPAPQPAQPTAPQQPVQPAQAAAPQQPVQPQQMAQPQQPTQPKMQQPQMGQPGPQQFGQQPQMGQPGPQQFGQQPQMSQPGPQQFGQQPQMVQRPPMGAPVGGGFNAFMNTLKADPIRWMEIGGLFLIFISIFLPFWITAKVPFFGISESAGLWGSGWFWVLVALSFIIVVAAQVLIWIDAIPPLSGIVQAYKRLPFSQFYIPAYVFLMCLLYVIVNLATIKGGEYLKIYFGVAFWLCLVGTIVAVVPGIIKLAQKQPYYV